MKYRMDDQKRRYDVSGPFPNSGIQARDESDCNGEQRDMRDNEHDLPDVVRQRSENRQHPPFVVRHRIQLVGEEQPEAEIACDVFDLLTHLTDAFPGSALIFR